MSHFFLVFLIDQKMCSKYVTKHLNKKKRKTLSLFSLTYGLVNMAIVNFQASKKNVVGYLKVKQLKVYTCLGLHKKKPHS